MYFCVVCCQCDRFDQEKVFALVDHGFLFVLEELLVLVSFFLSWLGLLFKDTSCLVNVGGGAELSERNQTGMSHLWTVILSYTD